MNQTNQQHGVEDDDEPISLKRFLLQAVLWLPLAFFFWFAMRTAVISPIVRGVDAILPPWMPDVVVSVEQDMIAAEDELLTPVQDENKPSSQVAVMFVNTKIPAEGHAPNAEGKVPVISIPFNPLIYCYGIPILLGLVMATPLNWRRTFLQIGVGLLVMYPLQVFGVLGDVLKELAFNHGPNPKAMLAAHGVNETVIAIWYQFGYLILPPLVPVVAWILFNRDFVEKLRDVALPNFSNNIDEEHVAIDSRQVESFDNNNAPTGLSKASPETDSLKQREPVGPFAGLSAGQKDQR